MRRARCSRAQSMVEFALVVPLFLGVLLSIFETARFMATYIGISNGVHSGARIATVASNSDDTIKDRVIAAVMIADTTTLRSSVVITPSPTRTALSPVTVSATYTFTWNPAISSLLGAAGLGSVTVQQQATMNVE